MDTIRRAGRITLREINERWLRTEMSDGVPAFYRVGEFYENGWGVEKNLELAKEYYRVAYRENHHLAIKKLSEFDFLH